MRDPLPLLRATDFPPLRRRTVDTLQVNLGYLCNQSCVHCHVNAGPNRTELMSAETVSQVVHALSVHSIRTLDLTGGAPEMNPHFRELVKAARALGVHVIDRCNLTILQEPGQHDLAQFLASEGVEIVASLPCYLEDNVDKQRGRGVFQRSIEALQLLNALGYGIDPQRPLSLVYNPQGPSLPPPQQALEADYRRMLGERFDIRFTRLLALANMPIARFGSTLMTHGQLQGYVSHLRAAHQPANLANVMCRTLVSVDWQGYLYDCDFNQMLGLPVVTDGDPRAQPLHLNNWLAGSLNGEPIVVADHCWGCTAGQGSSCGGALA